MNVEGSTWKPRGMRATGLFYMRTGRDLKLKAKLRIHHRVYSRRELRALLESAGWRYVKCYGEFDLAPFRPDSKRIIACCRAQQFDPWLFEVPSLESVFLQWFCKEFPESYMFRPPSKLVPYETQSFFAES